MIYHELGNLLPFLKSEDEIIDDRRQNSLFVSPHFYRRIYHHTADGTGGINPEGNENKIPQVEKKDDTEKERTKIAENLFDLKGDNISQTIINSLLFDKKTEILFIAGRPRAGKSLYTEQLVNLLLQKEPKINIVILSYDLSLQKAKNQRITDNLKDTDPENSSAFSQIFLKEFHNLKREIKKKNREAEKRGDAKTVLIVDSCSVSEPILPEGLDNLKSFYGLNNRNPIKAEGWVRDRAVSMFDQVAIEQGRLPPEKQDMMFLWLLTNPGNRHRGSEERIIARSSSSNPGNIIHKLRKIGIFWLEKEGKLIKPNDPVVRKIWRRYIMMGNPKDSNVLHIDLEVNHAAGNLELLIKEGRMPLDFTQSLINFRELYLDYVKKNTGEITREEMEKDLLAEILLAYFLTNFRYKLGTRGLIGMTKYFEENIYRTFVEYAK